MRPSAHLEHAWLNDEPPRLFQSKHHPHGDGERRFNEDKVRELMMRWQREQKPELLDQILSAAEPVLKGALLSRNGCTPDFEETVNSLRLKLWRKLPAFDPDRGRAFTFVSLIASQGLTELWAKRSLQSHRFPEANVSVLDHPGYSTEPAVQQRAVSADIAWRIRQVRVCAEEQELPACRWLVEGQLSDQFTLKRHECADSMSAVWDISHQRSRQLCDQITWGIRLQLLPIVTVPRITATDLKGTRGHSWARLSRDLAAADCSRFFYLTRGLSPTAFFSNGWELAHVLHGHPDARPLFSDKEG